MSVRSASRGSPAAKSIRLALRTSSIVETRSASFVRWVLRCFGRRCLSSELTLSAISVMPFIMCFQGPPGLEPLNHTPLPHVNSLASKLMDGKRFGDFKNIHRRFSRWAEKGLWTNLLSLLTEDADEEYVMIDSTLVRVHQHSSGAVGRTPSDQAIGRSRGGLTTKIHARVDALGNPTEF